MSTEYTWIEIEEIETKPNHSTAWIICKDVVLLITL